jgi:hypothetical protein
LEANELQTITEEERIVREDLKEIVKYFRERGMMPSRENKDDSILSLRKILQISNLVNLNEIITSQRTVLSDARNGTLQYIKRYHPVCWKVPFNVLEGTVCISYHNPSFAEISSIR